MILINLLPHREAARKKQKDQFFTQLGLSALLGGIVCGAVFTWYQGQIASQQDRNAFLQAEIKKLDEEIKDIANLKSAYAELLSGHQGIAVTSADIDVAHIGVSWRF